MPRYSPGEGDATVEQDLAYQTEGIAAHEQPRSKGGGKQAEK